MDSTSETDKPCEAGDFSLQWKGTLEDFVKEFGRIPAPDAGVEIKRLWEGARKRRIDAREQQVAKLYHDLRRGGFSSEGKEMSVKTADDSLPPRVEPEAPLPVNADLREAIEILTKYRADLDSVMLALDVVLEAARDHEAVVRERDGLREAFIAANANLRDTIIKLGIPTPP